MTINFVTSCYGLKRRAKGRLFSCRRDSKGSGNFCFLSLKDLGESVDRTKHNNEINTDKGEFAFCIWALRFAMRAR